MGAEAVFLSPLSSVPLVSLVGFGLYELGFPGMLLLGKKVNNFKIRDLFWLKKLGNVDTECHMKRHFDLQVPQSSF
ncbi:unnamed protein product [Sphenostylis stenocarpa]|uniref:Uncharacterized protein n=1 Tax=Sphenostylis stenocarpa TaxID=92480 RepID=A0AA86VZT3_9FABA|nr:unnamed protein product [Sphenostylis stenocarpa]